jgi:NAD(P)-dependent dehydrogenase (short-subunit alcohol dehydrogenase family)
MIAPDPAYRVSKAALNCLTAVYAYELENEGFTFVAVSPGVSANVKVHCANSEWLANLYIVVSD